MATLSATGQDVFHNYFFPFLEGFVHTPANDIEALERTFAELGGEICGMLIEPVQGECGQQHANIYLLHNYTMMCDAVV